MGGQQEQGDDNQHFHPAVPGKYQIKKRNSRKDQEEEQEPPAPDGLPGIAVRENRAEKDRHTDGA